LFFFFLDFWSFLQMWLCGDFSVTVILRQKFWTSLGGKSIPGTELYPSYLPASSILSNSLEELGCKLKLDDGLLLSSWLYRQRQLFMSKILASGELNWTVFQQRRHIKNAFNWFCNKEESFFRNCLLASIAHENVLQWNLIIFLWAYCQTEWKYSSYVCNANKEKGKEKDISLFLRACCQWRRRGK